MVKKGSYTVRKFPTSVCISIKKPKGRAYIKKKKYRRRAVKGKKVGKRRRKVGRRTRKLKTRKRSMVNLCVSKSRRTRMVCQRLARNNCLTRKGSLKKKKVCRSIARHRGLKPKTRRSRRRRSALSSAGTFFGTPYKALGDLVMP